MRKRTSAKIEVGESELFHFDIFSMLIEVLFDSLPSGGTTSRLVMASLKGQQKKWWDTLSLKMGMMVAYNYSPKRAIEKSGQVGSSHAYIAHHCPCLIYG